MHHENYWIDGHCHLADQRISSLLPEVIERSRKAGICGWVQGGVSPEDWSRQIELQNQFRREGEPGLLTCFGIHPWRAARLSRSELQSELQSLKHFLFENGNGPSAVGELGLDFSSKLGGKAQQEIQIEAFEKQLELALQARRPVIFHIVKAHSESLEILNRFAPFPAKGIVHSFSASTEIMKEYLSLDFFISVGGSITQKGFQKLKSALKWIPNDRLIVETDSPDQLPRLQGLDPSALNEPSYLVGIAQAIAEIRGESASADSDSWKAVLTASTKNLKRLFCLDKSQ